MCSKKRKIHNWGIEPSWIANIQYPRSRFEVTQYVRHANVPMIARGNGRCYGDSALQTNLVSTLSLNRFLAFDPDGKTITCQAGVLLWEILEIILPHGLFLPVVPGTSLITVGGAIAANVHGKNHPKVGSIANHVLGFELIGKDGKFYWCSASENNALFARSIGGMGLSGVITTVKLQLRQIPSAYLKHTYHSFSQIEDVVQALLHEDTVWPYRVAWLDSLNRQGRCILQSGRWCPAEALPSTFIEEPFRTNENKPWTIPKLPTGVFLNHLVLRTYNSWRYARLNRSSHEQCVHYSDFFFPLDQVRNWNRLYGPNGFLQYQFVLPTASAVEGMAAIWQAVQSARCCSYLAVLKALGNDVTEVSTLSFPQAGLTLALDFKRTAQVLSLLDQLDQLVLQYGGRIYLAKDARMSARTFAQSYPKATIPEDVFQSLQSQRLRS